MIIEVEHRKRKDITTVNYNIEFISNWCFKEYQGLNSKVLQMFKIQKQLTVLAEKLGKVKADKQGYTEAIKTEIEQLTVEAKEGKDIIKWQWEILKELLESNDYDFELSYWEKTTAKDVVSKFLNSVFGVNEEIKKKLHLA